MVKEICSGCKNLDDQVMSSRPKTIDSEPVSSCYIAIYTNMAMYEMDI